MNATEIIEVVSAYKAGKRIEFRWHRASSEWFETNNPSWNFNDIDFRVKPDEPREWWIDLDSRRIVLNGGDGDPQRVKVREVLE